MVKLGRWAQLFFAVAAFGVPFLAMKTGATPALATGRQSDSLSGKQLFDKYCVQCHALDYDKKGPRLRGVFGRRSGAVPTFKYSEALKKANVIWDLDSLDRWLASPDDFIPDNDMEFKITDPDKRAAVISYLRELSN